MDIIFLFYGLAFLALGLVIVVRNERGSPLNISRHLWLLAGFGFVHGFLEWTELWRVVRGDTPMLAATRPFILLASFLLLFEFGRRLVLGVLSEAARERRAAALLQPWIYVPMFAMLAVAVGISTDRMAALAVWSRYLPGFVGSCLAGAGCYLYRLQRVEAEDSMCLSWYVAAAGFFAYGIFGGLIVTHSDAVAGVVLDESAFAAAVSVPVQLLRATSAVLIATAMGRVMGMFADERRERLRHAVDAGQYSLAQLQETKARYEALLNAVPDAVVGLDSEGRLTFANEPALATLGYARNELLGQPFHALAHHTTADGKPHAFADCPIHKTLSDGQARSVDADLLWRKNRTWFPAAYHAVPLRRADKVFGVVVLLRNLAERT